MGLDDLGSLAAELRERVRARREAVALAEAASAEWLDRIAKVSKEAEGPDAWQSTGSAPLQAAPPPDPARRQALPAPPSAEGGHVRPPVGPFGWMNAPVQTPATAPRTPVPDVVTLELQRRLTELTKDLAAARAALLDLQLHNDALVSQVAALRTSQQRRAPGSSGGSNGAGARLVDQPRARVDEHAADNPADQPADRVMAIWRPGHESASATSTWMPL